MRPHQADGRRGSSLPLIPLHPTLALASGVRRCSCSCSAARGALAPSCGFRPHVVPADTRHMHTSTHDTGDPRLLHSKYVCTRARRTCTAAVHTSDCPSSVSVPARCGRSPGAVRPEPGPAVATHSYRKLYPADGDGAVARRRRRNGGGESVATTRRQRVARRGPRRGPRGLKCRTCARIIGSVK